MLRRLFGLIRGRKMLCADLADVLHCLMDLAHARRLLSGRSRDLRRRLRGRTDDVGQHPDGRACVVYGLDSFTDAFGALLGGHHRDIRCLLNFAENLADLRGRSFRLVGERLDLRCHYAKPSAVLARSRGFNGRIQGQKIDLLGDIVDGCDDLSDCLRLFGQRQDALGDLASLISHRAHGGDRIVDRFAPCQT
jgi:hypothetical protein